jgi:FkbM family methyltransferase
VRRILLISSLLMRNISHQAIEPEAALLPSLLPSGAAFFDIGANKGLYTSIASHYVEPELVYAFEPQAHYIRRLQRHFPKSFIAHLALSDRTGEALLKVPRIAGVEYSTRGTLERFLEGNETGARFEKVQTETLDSFCTRMSIDSVGCMKIDVEGHELHVLEGARKTIERHHPTIIIEIEQRHHPDKDIRTIFTWITNRGYDGYFLESANHILTPLTDFDPSLYQRADNFKTSAYINNFIFLRKGAVMPKMSVEGSVYEPIEVYSPPISEKNKQLELWVASLQTYRTELTLRTFSPHNIGATLLRHPWKNQRRILCLHWTNSLYVANSSFKAYIRLLSNLIALWILKHAFRFKIIWFVHNAHGHDLTHAFLDELSRRSAANFADAIIAQQQETRAILSEKYPHKLVRYIGHNYIDAYGPRINDRQSARKRFGFTPEDIVLISLGQMRPYKRNEELIRSVRVSGNAHLKLWIVGSAGSAYVEELRQQAADDSRIKIEPRFIPDGDMPAYLAASDYALFCYDDSELTSGVLLLALSYGLPVISNRFPGAEMIVDGVNGFLYSNIAELTARLRSLSHASTTVFDPHVIINSVSGQGWEEVALCFREISRELFRGHAVRTLNL